MQHYKNYFSSKYHLEKQNLKTQSLYPVNKNGQTYGPNYYGSRTIEEPDLLAAIGIGGISGYVLTSDLLGPIPRTPEEAIEIQKNRKSPIFIPLYEKDGRTVIGKFQVGD